MISYRAIFDVPCALAQYVGQLLKAERRVRGTRRDSRPYWTAPGGGVEDTDTSVETALHRELAEELGAHAAGTTQVFLFSTPSDAGVAVQHFFNRGALLTKVGCLDAFHPTEVGPQGLPIMTSNFFG